MGGFKNPASASASWAIVRKKLLANNANTTPQSTPKSAAKTNAGGGIHDDDGNAKFTPINTPKKTKRGVKSEERIDPKMEEDENHDVALASIRDSVIPHEAGETRIKKEDIECEEVKPALSTPTKKRALKAKDENGTSAKRTKRAVTDTTAAAAIIPDLKKIPLADTIIPANDGDSNGLVQGETLSEEAQKGQGN